MLVVTASAARLERDLPCRPTLGPWHPPAPSPTQTCLVTGATGYIGGRLVPELLDGRPPGARDDPAPRAAARPPVGRPRRDRAGRRRRTPDQVAAACAGVDVVYYLIHALGSGPAFEATDRATAAGHGPRGRRRPGSAGSSTSARSSPSGEELSPHLRSRAEVAEILLGVRGADRRAAGRRGHRLGLGVVRDAALPDRAAAGDGHAALGAQPDPADRRPRRAALPGRLRRPAGRRCTAASTSAARTS